MVGVDKVSRFVVGLAEKYGDDLLSGMRPALVNGDLGLILPGGSETAEVRPRVMTFTVRDGRVAEVFDILTCSPS
ncbi:hypothetical protein FHX42_002828 [Saccharopolyspora lacisalsi]|uniref:SnoaL-like domain-containing protein n=1 Tax=Halosaccharopolyspora lacisalsi TaxID=1000566 RepID=A0A839E152_9PSEU|nr:hypothetical protein [Halosaccharopolyspora lacisalsi]